MVSNREEIIYEELQHLQNKLDALELIKSYGADCDIIKDLFYDNYIIPFKEYSASYEEIDELIDSTKLESIKLQLELLK